MQRAGEVLLNAVDPFLDLLQLAGFSAGLRGGKEVSLGLVFLKRSLGHRDLRPKS
jgi:hypothetical protein